MTISDETLVSYMDGELTPAEAGRVESALAGSPELLRGLLAMLRADKAAGKYFHTIDDRPLPAGIVTALEQFPTAASTEDTADNVVPLAGASASAPVSAPAPAYAPRRAAWHLPLAASIALAIGLGAGLNLGVAPRDAGEAGSLIAASQPLYDVLESVASGQTVALEGETTRYATPLMTVAAADGAYCREFEIAGPQVIIRGAACRQGDSSWLVAVQTAEATTNADGNYRTASEQRPAAIAAFLATTAPVEATAEQILIANKWTEN